MKCFISAGLLAATLLGGCSDEREPVPEPIPDAGFPAEAAAKDAAAPDTDVSIDVATDGYIDLFDVFPIPDGGCPDCIRDRCSSQINACFNNPACTAGLLCTLQMCGGLFGEGGMNPTNFLCVLGCFNGDQNLAFMAISSLTCVTMTCGSVCNLLDAGSDVRSNADVDAGADAPRDASIDASPEDAGPDASPEDTGADTAPDSADRPDGDGASPGDDAADATADTDGQLDTGSPDDVTPDTDPPSDGSAE